MTPTTSSLEARPDISALSTTASSELPPVAGSRSFALSRRSGQIAYEEIGLFGLFGSGNSGNDGSLEAMLRFLRGVRPDAKIVCYCSARDGAPERVARALGVAAIPFALPAPANTLLRALDRLSLKGPRLLAGWIGAIRHARNLDVLIVPGTGILDDFGEGPLGMPLRSSGGASQPGCAASGSHS